MGWANLLEDEDYVEKSPVVPLEASLNPRRARCPPDVRAQRSTEVPLQPMANHEYTRDPSQDRKDHPDNPQTH